jgi:chlorophyll synthase
MTRFIDDPVARATWLSALGVTVYVSGMMVSAFAVRAVVTAS